MRVLIVEDEWPTAEDIKLLMGRILGSRLSSVTIETTLASALERIHTKPVDLLLLDLNLHGRDGFELLKQVVAGAFHTIIISANTNRALEAFEYGVLDFVPKPYSQERLGRALARLDDRSALAGKAIKRLAVRQGGSLSFVAIEQLHYIKGADVCAELHLLDGTTRLSDKTLHQLSQLLPDSFQRIHKSYIVDLSQGVRLHASSGGKYLLELRGGEQLPVSRKRYGEVKQLLAHR